MRLQSDTMHMLIVQDMLIMSRLVEARLKKYMVLCLCYHTSVLNNWSIYELHAKRIMRCAQLSKFLVTNKDGLRWALPQRKKREF